MAILIWKTKMNEHGVKSLSPLELAVVRSDSELAAAELARLQEERLEIAESIHATLDDGEAPDNLAECVSYLMLQEYYPMRATIDRLTAELKALRQA